jgi:hypothetical protein
MQGKVKLLIPGGNPYNTAETTKKIGSRLYESQFQMDVIGGTGHTGAGLWGS